VGRAPASRRPQRAEPATVADLDALFRGDLRGTFRALDAAAHGLVGYGPRDADAPMTAADVRAVLCHRYAEELAASLPDALAATGATSD